MTPNRTLKRLQADHAFCLLWRRSDAFSTGMKQTACRSLILLLQQELPGCVNKHATARHFYRVSFEHCHVPRDESLLIGTHRLIETVTCDEFGGLQFILQSNLLPGTNCTVSWTSGISSASSFSDLITSSLWNRDNVWQGNRGKSDSFI